jgi:hypothetical protein
LLLPKTLINDELKGDCSIDKSMAVQDAGIRFVLWERVWLPLVQTHREHRNKKEIFCKEYVVKRLLNLEALNRSLYL